MRIVVVLLLSLFTPATSLTQSPIPIPDYVSGYKSDEIVRNAPYSAKTHFSSTHKRAEGKAAKEDAVGNEARDSQGRTYT